MGVSSVLLLWGFQISVSGSGIPAYFILFIPLFFILHPRMKDVYFFISLNVVFFAISLLQIYQGVVFTTPARSFGAVPVYCFAFVFLGKCFSVLRGSYDALKTFFLSVKYLLFIQVLVQLVQLVLWMNGVFNTNYNNIMGMPRVYGLFAEPSHVAFSLSPFIYLLFFETRLMKEWIGKWGILSIFVIFILCPSTTLVGIIGLALFFRQWKSVSSIRAFAARTVFNLVVIGPVIWSVIYIPALSDRMTDLYTILDDPSAITTALNLSSLLLYKGYEMARASLTHFVLGVGFLNLQFLNEYSAVSLLNEWLYEANKADGTSFGFKAVGEYGYIGLSIIVYAIAVFVKNLKKAEAQYVLENSLIFGLIVTCLRGASYFDGLPLLASVVLYQKICVSSKQFVERFLKVPNTSHLHHSHRSSQ